MTNELKETIGKVRPLVTRRRKLILRIKEISNGLRDALTKKKEITDIVKKNKEERNKSTEMIKQEVEKIKQIPKIEMSERPGRIKSIINRLDWKVQTEVMPYEKEKELTKKIKELNKQLEEAEKAAQSEVVKERLRFKIKDIEKEKRLLHSTVVAYSNEWKELQKRIDNLRDERSKISKQINSIDKEVNELNSKISNIKKEMGAAEAQRIEKEMVHESARKEATSRKIEEKTKDVLEKFKKSRKLTTEDLLILQASGKDII